MDLPKAFCCVVHDLVLAKLTAYGFDNNSLKPINNFFGCRKFMTEIVSSYCPYLSPISGCSSRINLGSLIFNIYMCDLSLCDCETKIINYTCDTTLFACEPNMDLVLSKLEKDASTVFRWFQNNYLKVNSEKSHLLTIFNILMLG